MAELETSVRSEKEVKNSPRITKTGWMILGSCGAIAGTIYAVATPFVMPALRRYCLPYVPATSNQVANVMALLRGRQGSLVDLGSGDGRIVSLNYIL